MLSLECMYTYMYIYYVNVLPPPPAWNHAHAVDALIAAGADPNARTPLGAPPRDHAQDAA